MVGYGGFGPFGKSFLYYIFSLPIGTFLFCLQLAITHHGKEKVGENNDRMAEGNGRIQRIRH